MVVEDERVCLGGVRCRGDFAHKLLEGRRLRACDVDAHSMHGRAGPVMGKYGWGEMGMAALGLGRAGRLDGGAIRRGAARKWQVRRRRRRRKTIVGDECCCGVMRAGGGRRRWGACEGAGM